jgi:hypothetical protein
VAKQQRVDVCTELRQLASDDKNFLSRITTGDLAPFDFFLFPKMKLNLKGRRFDTTEEIQAESQTAWYSDSKGLPGSVPRGDGGTGVYMREGITSRVMAVGSPCGEFL